MSKTPSQRVFVPSMAIFQADRIADFGCFGSRAFPTRNGMKMAGVQLQRSNPPRTFTTDGEAYEQHRLSLMFTRCMGAKAAVEHSGVDTGFTRLMGCWNVRAIGRRRR